MHHGALRGRIRYEDGRAVVVDKPPGMETTGRDLADARALQHKLAVLLGRPVWAVHQLDKDTSGLVLFVTRRSLVEVWQRRLGARQSRKRYLAFIHGTPTWTGERRVRAPLAYDASSRCQRVAEGGKPAETRVRLLAQGPRHALVEAELVTGRTHQARVHLASLSHPLVGEHRYRTPPCAEHPRQALHAWRLEARGGGVPLLVTAPLPQDLVALASRLQVPLPGVLAQIEARGRKLNPAAPGG